MRAPSLVTAGVVGATIMVGTPWALPSGAAPPPPPAPFTCTGTLAAPQTVPAGTYASLTLPPQSVCQVASTVRVLAPVSLGRASGLLMQRGNLSVQGSLTVGPQAVFAADLKKENAPVSILGAVKVLNDGVFLLGTEDPYGPVFANIQGRVYGRTASAIVIQNTFIAGSATVSGGGADNKLVDAIAGAPGNNYTDFEDDQIRGQVSEVGYGGIWGGLIRTIVHGSVTFAYNSQQAIDEYDIGSNVISGTAFCQGNNPVPNTGHSLGAPSIVGGATFGDQAATCTGVPGGVTGPPPPH